MKQILLFDTALGTGNLGDEIIYEYVKKGLSPVLDENLSFRLATHVENYSPLQMLKGSRRIRQFAEESDLKFVCGTNLVSDDLKHLSPQWMLNPFNKKLYEGCVLVGVGRVSKFKDKPNHYTEKLYQDVLSKKYAHSVRDEQTKKTLEDMGFRAINTGCPTLWDFNEEKCSRIPRKKAPNAIVTVSGYGHQQNREQDQKLIDIVLRNYTEVYAWIQTINDEPYLNSLQNSGRIKRIYSFKRYEELLNSGRFDYIGTRLHGGVYALLHDVRGIVVAIDDRAKNFHASNNLPIILRENIEEVEDLFIRNDSFVTDIHVDREAVRDFLSQFETGDRL